MDGPSSSPRCSLCHICGSRPRNADVISSSSLLAQDLEEVNFQVHLAIEKWNDRAVRHYTHSLQLSVLQDSFHRITSNCSLELPLGRGPEGLYMEGVGKCKLSILRPILKTTTTLPPFLHLSHTSILHWTRIRCPFLYLPFFTSPNCSYHSSASVHCELLTIYTIWKRKRLQNSRVHERSPC